METAKKALPLSTKIALGAMAVVIAASAVTVGVVLNAKEDEKPNSPIIGYADNAKMVLDEKTLQDAVNEAMENAKEGNITMKYKNDAYSEDGKTFACYIANSQYNLHDMFINIYADAELTDQLYLSGLVRPGGGFEEITLEKTLDKGSHRVYVALTLVKTAEDNTQTIVNQLVHTMDFHVIE